MLVWKRCGIFDFTQFVVVWLPIERELTSNEVNGKFTSIIVVEFYWFPESSVPICDMPYVFDFIFILNFFFFFEFLLRTALWSVGWILELCTVFFDLRPNSIVFVRLCTKRWQPQNTKIVYVSAILHKVHTRDHLVKQTNRFGWQQNIQFNKKTI